MSGAAPPWKPDGEACRRWIDLEEPLWHNKTVFTMMILGEEADRLKARCRLLNRAIPAPSRAGP